MHSPSVHALLHALCNLIAPSSLTKIKTGIKHYIVCSKYNLQCKHVRLDYPSVSPSQSRSKRKQITFSNNQKQEPCRIGDQEYWLTEKKYYLFCLIRRSLAEWLPERKVVGVKLQPIVRTTMISRHFIY